MSTTTTSAALLPTYARADVTFVSGEGAWLVDVGRKALPRPARRDRGRRPRPLPSRAARRRARAARLALAHLEPLLDRADDQARRPALRPFRRGSCLLLQLRRRGDRGGAQVGAQGDRQARGRRAGRLVPRPHARRARGDRPAGQACRLGAARAGGAVRTAERRRVARSGRRGGDGRDPDRAGSGRRWDPSCDA